MHFAAELLVYFVPVSRPKKTLQTGVLCILVLTIVFVMLRNFVIIRYTTMKLSYSL
ncbi:hypothetical protein SAMN05421747_1295 [Parapedobacter composti]|uniref:Uncharacterized protein n=1 Tax=Parapedobacter composti TaxID=623281 RepID=A0A1I1MFN0_9SPHI|nr:hypothetical protein SAMN05421747_1295 [Parapedobacter composti]